MKYIHVETDSRMIVVIDVNSIMIDTLQCHNIAICYPEVDNRDSAFRLMTELDGDQIISEIIGHYQQDPILT